MFSCVTGAEIRWVGKRSLSLLVCTLAALLVAAPASAHLRTGTVAVAYGARITSAPPSTTAAIFLSDRGLRMTVAPGHTATVLGYLREPFLRIDSRGVWANAGSPTAEAAGVLPKRSRATSGWILVHPGGRTAAWHDGRVQRPAARSRWSVPVLVDGRREAIAGELWRVPAPALWRWILLAVVVAACGAALAAAVSPVARSRLAVVLGVGGIVAALVAEGGFVLGAYASPGTWIAAVDELAFTLAGVAVLAWAPKVARAPGAAGLGLLAVAVGLSRGAIFLDGLVLSAIPGTATRALVAAAIGAGIASTVAAGLQYLRHEQSFAAMSSALGVGH